MPEIPISLIKGDKVSSATDYRDALPENMIAVQRDILGAKGYMSAHPGLSLHGTSVGVDRGGYWNERLGIHYRVSGQSLVSLDSSGASSVLGAISGYGRVSMTHSFNTQAIVADGKLWLHDGTTLTQVTDSDLGNPIDITWIDGYYFMTDGEYIYHTNISDETAIDPLKFATAEFSPDPSLGVDTTSDNQVIVFGRYSLEYFTNIASENFAFRRVAGKSIKAGVVGTNCYCELDGVYFILGGAREESPSLHYISAGSYTSVATREVDKVISEYNDTELSEAFLETRVQDRDKFIIVHLPNHTLLFNATIAKSIGADVAWTIIKTGVNDGVWRGSGGVYDPRIGKWVYGDKLNSNIGILDNTVATQYSESQEFVVYSPLVDLERASIDEIEITTIPGHQVNTDNVTCSISLTYDGVTYGQEWFKLYGSKSNYGTRFIIRRLGDVKDSIGFKVRSVTSERLTYLYLKVSYG